jgi:hypothetical protein
VRKAASIPANTIGFLIRHLWPSSIEATKPRFGQLFFFDSPLFEIALVLVRLVHVASFIVNADHSIV